MKDRAIVTFGALIAALVGLGASVATAIDDLGPEPTFCSSACEVVRQSEWSKPLGIPMSLLGVAFFAAMVVLAVVDRPRLRKVLAIAGAAWGVWLIVLQGSVIGAWCKLCLVADPAAIVGGGCVLAGARTIGFAWRRAAVATVGLAAIVGALAIWTRAPEVTTVSDGKVPAFVEEAQVPGKVTIVEVVDFECPFCRKMQTRLDEALKRTQVPVRIVRKMMPLPMHQYAIPAAVAYCCAEEQGKGEEMARELFAAPPADLHFDDCKKLAEKIGCDMERFMKHIPVAKQRIMAEIELVQAAGIEALPTMFIGKQKVTGATLSTEELVKAIERTKR